MSQSCTVRSYRNVHTCHIKTNKLQAEHTVTLVKELDNCCCWPHGELYSVHKAKLTLNTYTSATEKWVFQATLNDGALSSRAIGAGRRRWVTWVSSHPQLQIVTSYAVSVQNTLKLSLAHSALARVKIACRKTSENVWRAANMTIIVHV